MEKIKDFVNEDRDFIKTQIKESEGRVRTFIAIVYASMTVQWLVLLYVTRCNY